MAGECPPLVTAIVLNYRTPQAAVLCVQALLNQTLRDRLEVLLVDNQSQDDSIGVFRARFGGTPGVKIVEVPGNRGYGGGNNFAEGYAKGEYIMVINPDNALEPEGLSKMIDVLQRDPSIGVIAPRLIHDDGTIRDSSRSFPSIGDVVIKRSFLRLFFPGRMTRYLRLDQDLTKVHDADWVSGACLLLRRSLFRELGGFDLRFFLFFEDIDFCRRVREKGLRVVYFAPVTAKDKKLRLSAGGFFSLFTKKTARIHLMSALRYFWKWKGRTSEHRGR